jgi:hypothetical protein
MNDDIRIFEVSECDWYIGAGTPEEIMEAYTNDTGVTLDDNDGQLPTPISDSALDTLLYHDFDDDEQPLGTSRTFREQLALEVAKGGEFPRLFASTEY